MKTFRREVLVSLVLLALWLVGFSPSSFAESKKNKDDEDEAKPCSLCKMSTKDTPVLLLANFKDKNGKEVQAHFDSLSCFIKYREKNKKTQKLLSAKVLDYETKDAKEKKFIEIEKAYFVRLKKLKGTMPPYLVAFSTKAKASSFAENNEGKVLTFSEAEDLIMQETGLMKDKSHKHEDGHHHTH